MIVLQNTSSSPDFSYIYSEPIVANAIGQRDSRPEKINI